MLLYDSFIVKIGSRPPTRLLLFVSACSHASTHSSLSQTFGNSGMAQETEVFLHAELGNTEVWVNRESPFGDCSTLDPETSSQSWSQTPENFPFKPSWLLHPPESFWTVEMRGVRERSLLTPGTTRPASSGPLASAPAPRSPATFCSIHSRAPR